MRPRGRTAPEEEAVERPWWASKLMLKPPAMRPPKAAMVSWELVKLVMSADWTGEVSGKETNKLWGFTLSV